MSKYRAAVIGCGRPSANADIKMQGYAIGYEHGEAYKSNERIELVAAADISVENAEAFAKKFRVPKIYRDYKEMLEKENLDIVSICTWPTLHREMTMNAAVAGIKMIWCEKPMAVGIEEIDEMVRTCSDRQVRLFINHQRRYEMPYQVTRQIIDDGVLGQIERLEGWVGRGWDLSSWGTHWVDMHRFFLHDAPTDWVLAQAPRSGKVRYGHPVEDQMLLQFMFSNGVISFVHLGNHLQTMGLRVIGEKGTISFLDGGVDFKIQHEKNASELVKKFLEGKQYVSGMDRALEDIILSYEKNQIGEIDVRNGARSAEIVLAAYQSAVEGNVLRLPLENRSFNLLKNFQI